MSKDPRQPPAGPKSAGRAEHAHRVGARAVGFCYLLYPSALLLWPLAGSMLADGAGAASFSMLGAAVACTVGAIVANAVCAVASILADHR
jgi:hypothetical protein